jgi:hypothetical protein
LGLAIHRTASRSIKEAIVRRTSGGSEYSFRFAGALLVTSAITVIMACGSKNPAAPSATSSSPSAFSSDISISMSAQAK